METVSIAKREKKWHINDRKLMIYVVVAGVIIFYMAFLILPIIFTVIGSFFNWNPMIGKFSFLGIDNYVDMLKDSILWQSLLNTFYLAAVLLAARTALGLIIAIVINNINKLKDFFRTIFFIPVITSVVAVSMVWRWMYDPGSGVFNAILNFFGLPSSSWLLDASIVIPAIILMTLWKDIGYTIVIYIAGLNGIPKTFYDAASIDGASKLQTFWHVTLPLLVPTTLFLMITTLIGYFQIFTQILILTFNDATGPGGPGTASYTLVYLIYDLAFNKYTFGRASAVSIMLFLIILAFSFIQLRFIKHDWEY